MAKQTLLLGAHMSIAGGFEKAIERAESIGCTCMQIFTKSNRQWQAKPISEEDASLFRTTLKQSSISPDHVVTHASYLINIGSAQHALYEKSLASLIDELERCDMLGIPYLVLHPGSSVQASLENTLETIVKGIDAALSHFKGKTKLLLETMSGQGSTVCYQLEHLAYIFKHTKHKSRLGVCADTCHIFAAGYDISTPQGYTHFWKQFDSLLGLEKLHAIHINGSKGKMGSRVDRHADVDKGEIGIEFFKLLMNDHRFSSIPKILEIPETHDMMHDYARNMDVLKKLIK